MALCHLSLSVDKMQDFSQGKLVSQTLTTGPFVYVQMWSISGSRFHHLDAAVSDTVMQLIARICVSGDGANGSGIYLPSRSDRVP